MQSILAAVVPGLIFLLAVFGNFEVQGLHCYECAQTYGLKDIPVSPTLRKITDKTCLTKKQDSTKWVRKCEPTASMDNRDGEVPTCVAIQVSRNITRSNGKVKPYGVVLATCIKSASSEDCSDILGEDILQIPDIGDQLKGVVTPTESARVCYCRGDGCVHDAIVIPNPELSDDDDDGFSSSSVDCRSGCLIWIIGSFYLIAVSCISFI